MGRVPPVPSLTTMHQAFNPLVGTYTTADGRGLTFPMLQAGRYWSQFCRHVGREDLITDERLATAEAIVQPANTAAAAQIVAS